MVTSFLKHRKFEISPMKVGKFLISVFVNKFFVICCYIAHTISKKFLTSQIVRNFIFNTGLSYVANTLKPLRGLKYSPFFIFKNLRLLTINGSV